MASNVRQLLFYIFDATFTPEVSPLELEINIWKVIT